MQRDLSRLVHGGQRKTPAVRGHDFHAYGVGAGGKVRVERGTDVESGVGPVRIACSRHNVGPGIRQGIEPALVDKVVVQEDRSLGRKGVAASGGAPTLGDQLLFGRIEMDILQYSLVMEGRISCTGR